MLQVPDFADSRWRSALFHIMRDQLDLTVRRQNRQCSARIGVLNGETDMEPEPTKQAQITLGHALEDIEPAMAKAFTLTNDIGRDGLFQAEGEIRRGAIAMNGAGLLAVVSLLGQSLHPLTVRLAALIYLAGLVAGCFAWFGRAAAARNAFFTETVFWAAFTKLKAHPVASMPLATAEEVDAAVKVLIDAIKAISAKLKKPGARAAAWTIVALICFFAATCSLVADFELSPPVHIPTITGQQAELTPAKPSASTPTPGAP